MMHAVLLTGNGGFERLEHRGDVAVPEPGPGEALVRIGAAGVNNTDINTRIGWYSHAVPDAVQGGAGSTTGWTGAPPVFPRIQGADACGRIVAVGAGVATSRIGERVLVEPVFLAPGGALADAVYFGSERDGAFAQYATVPSAHAHRIESALSDIELATFPCSYSAAANMLARADVAAGETVLVTGASGGVGSAAVQLARARGARVIAVADPAKAAAILALGAEAVMARAADPAAELGRESVDFVIDVVGGPGFPRLLDALKRGGRYAVAGAAGGADVALDLRTLYLKDLRLLGCTVLAPRVFKDLVALIEAGAVKPLLAATYPLAQIVEAQQAFMAKRHVGKIVLVPPGPA